MLMVRLYVKKLPPVHGGNVILSKESWDELVEYLSHLATVVNEQAKVIAKLLDKTGTNTNDIKLLAEIVGGIYDVEE
jgi:hypothetical protein